MEILKEFVEKAAEVLASRNAADGAGEDVVKHQRGDAEFGKGAAERLFDGAIDAAADEHAAAFDVHRANGIREKHDGKNEPGSGFADVAFGFAAGVVGGRGQVVQDDGGGFPKGNKGEEGSGSNNDARNCVATAAWSSRAVGNRAH